MSSVSNAPLSSAPLVVIIIIIIIYIFFIFSCLPLVVKIPRVKSKAQSKRNAGTARSGPQELCGRKCPEWQLRCFTELPLIIIIVIINIIISIITYCVCCLSVGLAVVHM